MGTFAEWQPAYAAHGIATFPVNLSGGQKKPAVGNYLKAGRLVSAHWATKFAEHEAFGFALNKRNGVAVLDVDTPDEHVLADAISRHGETPIIVRSGSGNHQAWYRHNGERRHVRPWADLPIDVLGDGYVVAPPSQGTRGSYQLIQGSLDDLDRLPLMRGVEDLAGRRPTIVPVWNDKPVGKPWSEMRDGDGRNSTLSDYVGRAAHDCRSHDKLLAIAIARNAECGEPLPQADVTKMVRYWWRLTERGQNNCGRSLKEDSLYALAASNPYAYALYGRLEKAHRYRDEFALANAIAVSLGWTLPRFKAARSTLAKLGFIRCIDEGGRGTGNPPIYTWAKGYEIIPQ